ncbi:hypothetical protein AB0M54_16820 [Actinoplanes sp. NPDC051470]|uniref:hypothetical protein n=1 Tax=unclassified Actinoplanes TaxID=2626549 RepID=UPI0034322B17
MADAAREDFDGASAEETVRALLDEHAQLRSIRAMDAFRATDPAGYASYLTEAEDLISADGPLGGDGTAAA